MCVCQNCGHHWQVSKHLSTIPVCASTAATVSVNTKKEFGSESVPIRYYGKGDENKQLIGYVEARDCEDCYTITQAQYSEAVQKCRAVGYERPQFRGNKRLRISMDE